MSVKHARFAPLLRLAAASLVFSLSLFSEKIVAQTGTWNTVTPVNLPTARHECAFGQLGDKFYLLGGRGLKPVQAYDPASNSWITLGFTPQEIHHFQAVEFHGLMYLICAFQGNFPSETGIPFIYIYDPLSDSWFVGPDIPSARVRGSAGVVLRDDKFYVVSGLTDGHRSGWVRWFDEYNPATNSWTVLPDAPRARDHFAAALVDDLLVCAGGRRSGAGTGFFGTFDSVVRKTDIYNFNTGTWSTLPSPAGDLPTGRAGCSAGVLDGEVIIIGGESSSQSSAHKQTQALDPVAGTWRTLTNLNTGRHGTQAIVNNGGIYIAAGSGNRGGSPELNSMEVFHLDSLTAPTGMALVAGLPSAASPDIPVTEPGDVFAFNLQVQHESGNQAILIHDLLFQDPGPFALLDTSIFPFALAPGKDFPLAFHFAPTDTGWYAAELKIVYGAALDTLVVPFLAESRSGCSTEDAPDGLVSVVGASTVQFSWNEVDQALKCELQGRRAGTSSFAKRRFNVPPHSISLPLSLFLPATTYEWKIRCACSLDPLEATPFSALAQFSTPAARTAQDAGTEWVLSPNPAPERVLLAAVPGSLMPGEGPWRVELLDLLGRSLHVQQFSGKEVVLERGTLSPGTYLVRISSGSGNGHGNAGLTLPLFWE